MTNIIMFMMIMITPSSSLQYHHHLQVLGTLVAGGPRVVFINLRGELPQILLPLRRRPVLQIYFHPLFYKTIAIENA